MITLIGVARESNPGEHRVALVPDVAKRFRAQGAEILIERGAGENSAYPDSDFTDVRWTNSPTDIWSQADAILCVQPPALEQVSRMKSGAILIGFLQPFQNPELVRAGRTSHHELRRRTGAAHLARAEHGCAVLASRRFRLPLRGNRCRTLPEVFPMLTYAAGTVRPARVLVIGAGVAGLQAIATAKRLGAIVEAYDVRPETREQIESLGAKFVDTGVAASGQGGYARELSEEEKRQQAERLGKVVAQCDALITTAAIPGRQAPRIINAAMVAAMKFGAVVVDMAAESGGNVEGTVAGEIAMVGHVKIVGHANLPSRMPYHASEMYARNLFNFLSPHLKDGALSLDWSDEVVSGAALTRDGSIVHAGVSAALFALESTGGV